MDTDQFERVAQLFAEDVFGPLLAQANILAADHVCEDDLWVVTPSSMIRRSILHAVCSRTDLKSRLAEHVPEGLRETFDVFAALDVFSFQEGDLGDDEKVALRVLDKVYAHDIWLWARDAFVNHEIEYPGMDLDGFEASEVSDAIIRLVTLAW
jgi:hypothetical protein